MRRDEVPPLVARLPRADVADAERRPLAHPGVVRVLSCAVEPVGREVHAGDLPAVLREPDDVAALAAADVDRATRLQRLRLRRHLRVDPAAPDGRRGAVALLPGLRLAHRLAGSLDRGLGVLLDQTGIEERPGLHARCGGRRHRGHGR